MISSKTAMKSLQITAWVNRETLTAFHLRLELFFLPAVLEVLASAVRQEKKGWLLRRKKVNIIQTLWLFTEKIQGLF